MNKQRHVGEAMGHEEGMAYAWALFTMIVFHPPAHDYMSAHHSVLSCLIQI
jgi:hypothetical protein